MLRRKQGNRQTQHNVIMLAFSGFIGFVRRFADLDPKVPQLLLQRGGMRQLGPNAQASRL